MDILNNNVTCKHQFSHAPACHLRSGSEKQNMHKGILVLVSRKVNPCGLIASYMHIWTYVVVTIQVTQNGSKLDRIYGSTRAHQVLYGYAVR